MSFLLLVQLTTVLFIATQNFQIQTMLSILKDKNFPETKDCVVEVPLATDAAVDTETSKAINGVQGASGSTRLSTTSLHVAFSSDVCIVVHSLSISSPTSYLNQLIHFELIYICRKRKLHPLIVQCITL
jgi:hypothetical protein